jgi:hypothetical protein
VHPVLSTADRYLRDKEKKEEEKKKKEELMTYAVEACMFLFLSPYIIRMHSICDMFTVSLIYI